MRAFLATSTLVTVELTLCLNKNRKICLYVNSAYRFQTFKCRNKSFFHMIIIEDHLQYLELKQDIYVYLFGVRSFCVMLKMKCQIFFNPTRSLLLSTSRTTFVIKNCNVGKNIKTAAVKMRIHHFIMSESGCRRNQTRIFHARKIQSITIISIVSNNKGFTTINFNVKTSTHTRKSILFFIESRAR